MSDNEKLDKLHEASTALLLAFDKAARSMGVSYMLDAGTLLGAVRHKSFIPWDDDADVCMMRCDYERFLREGKSFFTRDFELVVPCGDGEEKFYDFVPKVIFKKIVFDREGDEYRFYEGKYSHPSLDVFVIDRVPEGRLAQRLHTALLKAVYALAMGHREKIDYAKYTAAQSLVIAFLSRIGGRLPLCKIARLYEGIAKKYENTGKKSVMSTHSAMDAFGDCYKYEWYEKSVPLTINGREFPAPAGFDKILAKHYGDYMKLPDKEKRKPKHLDFDKMEFSE